MAVGDKNFLADANSRLGTNYSSVQSYLTNNGKVKKDSETYKKRLAEVQNWRGKTKRQNIVVSGKLIEEAKKIYGSAADLYNIPELKAVFEEGFVNQWSSEELLRAVDNTAWAKERSQAQETYDVLKTTDPTEAAARVEANASSVRRILAQKGVTATEEQIKMIAEKGTRNGWSGTQWDEYTASDALTMAAAQPAQGQVQQQAAPTATQLRTIAKNFGVPVADSTLNSWITDISSNKRTADQFTEYARASAQTLYPGLSERLQTNTFDEIVSPYKQLYADVLEVPEGNVDLTSPQFSNLFTAGDPQKPRMMTSTEWVGFLRKKPEWQNTRNAYNEYAQAANTLNKIFGGTR